jgi:hypothetical protein
LALAAIPAGPLAGALTEQGVNLVRRVWRDKGDRADRFVKTAAEAAGVPVEELMDQASGNQRLRELLATAGMRRASRTTFRRPTFWRERSFTARRTAPGAA